MLEAVESRGVWLQDQLLWCVDRLDLATPWIAALVILEAFVVGLFDAYYNPLWLDEIMGALIARLPTFGQIIAVCKQGADNQPALYHLLMHQSVRIFGNDALGLRVPSLVGFCVACGCIYIFVKRRSAGVWGILSILFLLQTKAWWFALDGRPYGIMLGLAGVAAVCWQNIVLDHWRAASLAGLAAALASAVNVHYFAILLFIPIWLAEAVRTFVRRKIDWPLWACCSLPLLLLLPYVPIIRVAKPNSGIPYAYFTVPSLWGFVNEFFTPTLAAFACGFVLYAASLYLRRRLPPAPAIRDPLCAYAPEACLVIAFATIPAFAILVAKYGTHIFFPRYGTAGVFGFAVLAGMTGWLAFDRRSAFGWMLVITLGLLVAHDQTTGDYPTIRNWRATTPTDALALRLPRSVLNSDLPIAFSDLHDYMQFFYYGDPKLRSRIYYPTSERLAAHYLGFTFHERMMIGSAPFFGTQAPPYDAFVRAHKQFYVFGSLEFPAWLVRALQSDRGFLQLVQGGPKDQVGNFFDTCLLANTAELSAADHPKAEALSSK